MSTVDTNASISGIVGLNPAELQKLLASGRSRNMYGPKLVEFEQSSEAAVDVLSIDHWHDLKGKEPATLYQGFTNALNKAKLTDVIEVKRVKDNVFLLHKERVKLALATLANNAASNTDDE